MADLFPEFAQHILDHLEPRTLLSADGLACGCEEIVYRLDGSVEVMPVECGDGEGDGYVGDGTDEGWIDETWIDETWLDDGSGDGWSDDDLYDFGDGYVEEEWSEGDWTDWEDFTTGDGSGEEWSGQEIYAFELAGMAGANFRGGLGGDSAAPIAILPALVGSALDIATESNDSEFVSATIWNYRAGDFGLKLGTIGAADPIPVGLDGDEPTEPVFVISAAPDALASPIAADVPDAPPSEPAEAVLGTIASASIQADLAAPLPDMLAL